MAYIEGVDRHQISVFPEALEDYVPANSTIRIIEAFVAGLDMDDLGFARAAPASEGRPGYDPRALLGLYIYGYLNRTRSSRRLEAETYRNVEVIWLMGKLQPDHKTIAEFRRRHTQALKKVTREFLMVCKDLDLIGAELVLIDGSKIRAVNSAERNFTKDRVDGMIRRIEESIGRYLSQMDWEDQKEKGMMGPTIPDLPRKLEAMRARLTELRQIQEQIEETGEQVSLTDPESRRMKVGKDLKVCYNAQIAVDPKHHLIVAHDVTNEENDLQQLEPMATAAKEALEVKSLEAAADAGYHNPSQIVTCEDNKILPYVPDPATSSSKNRKAGLFTKDHFRYDEATDAYQCPAGQWLHWSTQETRDGRLMKYYTNAPACRGCAMRAKCTKNKHGRRIMRIPEEAQVEAMLRRLAERPGLMLLRKSTVEHPFGTIKHGWDAGHFLLKGLRLVRGEFSLSTLAYNIRRTISVVGAECLLEFLRNRGKGLVSGLQPV